MPTLLESDREQDRAIAIIDPATPDAAVAELAARPNNGYRVRAALVLSAALPSHVRQQIAEHSLSSAFSDEQQAMFLYELDRLVVSQRRRRRSLSADAVVALDDAARLLTRETPVPWVRMLTAFGASVLLGALLHTVLKTGALLAGTL